MSYMGTAVNIPIGDMGIFTDDAQTITPPQGLILAENVQIRNGFLEKMPGSRKWNKTILPSLSIVAMFDWWPTETAQRLIAVTSDGKVWRFTDEYNFTEVLGVSGAPVTLTVTDQVVMVAGGQELAGRDRKLFILTGNNPIQVISGDGTTRRNILSPSTDWSGSMHPNFGIVYLNRLWVFGNKNQPHLMYGSNVLDHEDFTTIGSIAFVTVFPGDNERLACASNFKGRMVLFKYPFGIYFLNTDNPATPYAVKLGNGFGVASPKAATQVVDDLWVANSQGTISRLEATLNLGGLQQADVMKDMKCYRFINEFTSANNIKLGNAIWYENKKMAMFTYSAPSSTDIDRIFIIDFAAGRPRAVFCTKDALNCLVLRRDVTNVQRPFYGGRDGYIYQMDMPDRNVGGNAYSMKFQVPYLDFGFVDRSLAERNKNFDFMEVTFEPEGNWNLSADIYLDNRFSETVTFNMAQEDVLDKNFKLDKSRASGPGPRSRRVPIHGMGRRISARFYYNGLGNAKVSGVTYYFRAAGQAQKG